MVIGAVLVRGSWYAWLVLCCARPKCSSLTKRRHPSTWRPTTWSSRRYGLSLRTARWSQLLTESTPLWTMTGNCPANTHRLNGYLAGLHTDIWHDCWLGLPASQLRELDPDPGTESDMACRIGRPNPCRILWFSLKLLALCLRHVHNWHLFACIWGGSILRSGYGVGLVINRSQVQLLASALPGSLGQLSLPYFQGR